MARVVNVMLKCDNKTSFTSRAKAERKLKQIWKTSWLSQRKKPCRSYKCLLCNKWHLTSKGLKTKEQLIKERTGVDK
jgi:hypothetical protein